ncbi:DUF6090 family protein [Hyphococcus sp.]|uniref:DUF6090 family protein n=1 Tax=Hyphococcus sp. TaxID=2038636 RepID=UPI00207F8D94|nr:MAG: hypothetical protein DHS20C04_10050 [Marinicaulis sp.]
MILRRVTDAFRRQDWFTVFIETMIVVLGVFLGLQVNNWNEARQDRADETIFLHRLHDDLQHGEALTARLRDVRLRRAGILIEATDVVFERTDEPALDAEQCRVIGSSHYYNFAAPQLPSVMELISSGRMQILRDAELWAALIRFQQTREAIVLMIDLQTQGAIDLPSKYPDLIQSEALFDQKTREVQSKYQCDLAKMRQSQQFLNDLSSASDRNDAYLRDGLAPWSDQFDEVHNLVDQALGVVHPTGSLAQ